MLSLLRPRARFLLVDEHDLFLARFAGDFSKSAPLKDMHAFSDLHPQTCAHGTIIDIRRFSGIVRDSDIAESVEHYRLMRLRLGYPERLDRPQVILAEDREIGLSLKNTLSTALVNSMNHFTSDVDTAWRLVAPGAPMPDMVRRFLDGGRGPGLTR